MSNWRKHLFLIVYLAGMVLAIALLGFFLFRGQSRYAAVKDDLQKQESTYQRLTEARPYPSKENVKVLETNRDRLQVFLASLRDRLCTGEVPVEPIQRAQFPVRLESTKRELERMAQSANTAMPLDFYFGFQDYEQGNLPRLDDVPRLMVQLDAVRAICDVMFREKVVELSGIARVRFDQGEDRKQADFAMMDAMLQPTRRGRSARRPKTTTNEEKEKETPATVVPATRRELFRKEHLELSIVTKDENLWALIDALTRGPPFAVITDVSLESIMVSSENRPQARNVKALRGTPQGGGMMPDFFGEFDMMGGMRGPATGARRRPGATGGTEKAEESLRNVPHDERIYAGRGELVRAEIGVDIYRFCLPPEDDDRSAGGGRP